jgi:hypothetical protein
MTPDIAAAVKAAGSFGEAGQAGFGRLAATPAAGSRHLVSTH